MKLVTYRTLPLGSTALFLSCPLAVPVRSEDTIMKNKSTLTQESMKPLQLGAVGGDILSKKWLKIFDKQQKRPCEISRTCSIRLERRMNSKSLLLLLSPSAVSCS